MGKVFALIAGLCASVAAVAYLKGKSDGERELDRAMGEFDDCCCDCEEEYADYGGFVNCENCKCCDVSKHYTKRYNDYESENEGDYLD